VASLAPDVLAAVPKRALKTRLVVDGLANNAWVRDISGSLSVTALAQYVTSFGRGAPGHSSIRFVMTSSFGNGRQISNTRPRQPTGEHSFMDNPLFLAPNSLVNLVPRPVVNSSCGPCFCLDAGLRTGITVINCKIMIAAPSAPK
jgi:hypothetical protein